ncbi:MAG TPA: sigma 54-interacting transcriptional regulator [Polyangiaceae bacterium]|nr:sigma 54-interacting transcriptional regulator [Polyangiaceae bacterium]
MHGLPSGEDLDHETMWRAMRLLLERLNGTFDSETAMDDCLDLVVELLGADRGLIVVTFEGGSSQTITARKSCMPLSPEQREEISRTLVREALDSWSFVRCLPIERSDPSPSMATFGIVGALAAPLPGLTPGQPARGVLYVDFRDPRKHISDRHIEFFLAATTLLGAILDQVSRSKMSRAALKETDIRPLESRWSPSLEELLAPSSLALIRNDVLAAVHGNSPVLILGESGTGKTLLAHAIAEASDRRPIVRAILGSSDDLNTISSELFGHERGAFSGAIARRMGLVAFAEGGTLLLDEVMNFPTHAQKLLLDLTQFGTYRPLGYDRPEPKRANIRLIASTNGDVELAMRDGRFRSDLYQRLAGVVIELPPLRERREDIAFLAERALSADRSRQWALSTSLRRLLVSPSLEWSGNMRQLERLVLRARERALSRDASTSVLCTEHVDPRDLEGSSLRRTPVPPLPPSTDTWQSLQDERDRLELREQQLIRDALMRSSGVIAHAARELGIARTTLSSRVETLGLRALREHKTGGLRASRER